MVGTIRAAKRKSHIINLLKGLVFSSLLGLLFLYNINRPRIMVVHSYDPTLDTVKDFDIGTKKILESEIEPLSQNYYMNMLNKNTTHQKSEAGKEARAAIDRFKPKVLIAVGDEAQEFAAKYYVDRKKIRVLFTGVKGDFKKFGYEPGKNVAAVIEVPQMQEINTLINHMFGSKKNIRLAHLGDASNLVSLTEKILINFTWKNVSLIDSVKVKEYSDFKKAVTLLTKKCDVLLISSYRGVNHSEEADKEIASDEMMKWAVNNSSVPIISTFGYAVEDGAMVAIVPSAYEQGMMSMKSAISMLNDSNYFPQIFSKSFSVFLNDSHVQARKIDIPSIYKSFAVATQKLFGQQKGCGQNL